MKLKALDLFCGAGGATMGLMRAGFEVVGIDNNPKRAKRYPTAFICADALNPPVDLADFDFVWASPPCQRFSPLTPRSRVSGHSDNIGAIRSMLLENGQVFVIENVPQAPLRADLVLTGAMFDLDIEKRRCFEIEGFTVPFRLIREDWRMVTNGGLASCAGGATMPLCVWQNKERLTLELEIKIRKRNSAEGKRKAMGIDWMTRDELAQAIPPAYAEYIGRHAAKQITQAREVPMP